MKEYKNSVCVCVCMGVCASVCVGDIDSESEKVSLNVYVMCVQDRKIEKDSVCEKERETDRQRERRDTRVIVCEGVCVRAT